MVTVAFAIFYAILFIVKATFSLILCTYLFLSHKCSTIYFYSQKATEWHNLQHHHANTHTHTCIKVVLCSFQYTKRWFKTKQGSLSLAYFIFMRFRVLCIVLPFQRKAISNFVECLRSHSHIICLFIISSVCCGTSCLWLVRMHLRQPPASSLYFDCCRHHHHHIHCMRICLYVCGEMLAIAKCVCDGALVFRLSFRTILYVFHFYCDNVCS